MDSISEELHNILEDIFDTKLQKQDIEVLGTPGKGENYLGDIIFVKIDGPIRRNCVIKCGSKSKELRKVTPIKSLFENEIFIYENVLKHFNDFRKEKGLEPFVNIPECYGSYNFDETEVIVLADLRRKGFKMHNRKKCMDFKHIKLVLQAYAKWHGTSIALNDQNPEKFKELANNLMNSWNAFERNTDMRKVFQTSINNGLNWIKDHLTIDNYEKMVKFRDQVPDLCTTVFNPPTDKPYCIISHGDCWNNNFLFNYKKGALTSVKILDWQWSRLSPPLLELCHFLCCTISEEGLLNLNDILKIYYDSLNDEVNSLGSKLKEILPFATFIKEFHENVKYGLLFTFVVAKICTVNAEEASDMSELAEKGVDPMDSFNFVPKDTTEYVERVLPMVHYCLKENLL